MKPCVLSLTRQADPCQSNSRKTACSRDCPESCLTVSCLAGIKQHKRTNERDKMGNCVFLCQSISYGYLDGEILTLYNKSQPSCCTIAPPNADPRLSKL